MSLRHEKKREAEQVLRARKEEMEELEDIQFKESKRRNHATSN